VIEDASRGSGEGCRHAKEGKLTGSLYPANYLLWAEKPTKARQKRTLKKTIGGEGTQLFIQKENKNRQKTEGDLFQARMQRGVNKKGRTDLVFWVGVVHEKGVTKKSAEYSQKEIRKQV